MTPAAPAAAPWLSLLLSGFAGRALQVQACAPGPRPVAAILTAEQLLIAAEATPAAGRAAVAHAVAHLRHSIAAQPVTGLKPMSVAIVSALEDARVERLLMHEWPGLRRWWAPFHATAPHANDLSFSAFVTRLNRALFDPQRNDDSYWINKARRLFEAQAVASLHDHEAFRSIASILANDLGQMRVRFEPQAYVVEPAYRDDNSYLWVRAASDLPPPDATEMNVQPQRAALRLQAAPPRPDDADRPAAERGEIELGRYLLPEWDYRIERLRPDWCTVIETLPLATDAAALPPKAAALPAPLPRQAWLRLSRARRLRRQFEGDEIDLDAAIDVLVDRRLGLVPDARLFKRPGVGATQTSLLVLLDLSESANDAVASSRRSVLDLEKEAALRLAQTVGGSAHRLAVHGFNSNTRAHVAYQRLLDFDAPFDAAAVARIGAAPARHSTRVGAALRHACAALAGETAARRAVLLVTDGAPADIDVFDSRYLVEDARAAVQEAQRRGVQMHCITLDPAGEDCVRRIFGWNRYRVVANPTALVAHLRQVHARITAS